jgi:hypothetical protein
MTTAVQSAFPNTHNADAKIFASDGDLIGNDWSKNQNGEDYIRKIGGSGRSDLLEYVSTVLAPRLQEVDRAFAQKHGLQVDPQVEKAIATAHLHPLAGGNPASQLAPAPQPLTTESTQPNMPTTPPKFKRGGSVHSKFGTDAVQTAVKIARQLKRGRP